ncbi:hypothetical protein [Bdellovibrio bacteriovorus]|uniref:hypothetical protein n=1 Tax=Bdellovibrio TaxID=958 RepID=UPI0035A9515D
MNSNTLEGCILCGTIKCIMFGLLITVPWEIYSTGGASKADAYDVQEGSLFSENGGF